MLRLEDGGGGVSTLWLSLTAQPMLPPATHVEQALRTSHTIRELPCTKWLRYVLESSWACTYTPLCCLLICTHRGRIGTAMY
jgi:hypothetical protein